MTAPRYLVHGPRLVDPNELLFFDAWAWPTLMVYVRPRDLPPGFVGYKVEDEWPPAVLETLAAAHRTQPPAVALVEATARATPAVGPADAGMAAFRELGAHMLVSPLPTPCGATTLQEWLAGIDRATLSVARTLSRAGVLASAKLHADTVSRVLAPGWQSTVALCLPFMPRIDRAFATRLPELLAFLAADETRRRRETLYAWPALLARDDVPLASVPPAVAAAARDYVACIEASGLSQRGAGMTELLWKLEDPAMAGDLVRPVGADPRTQWAPFQRRGLGFGALEAARSDTPVALVSGQPRGYP